MPDLESILKSGHQMRNALHQDPGAIQYQLHHPGAFLGRQLSELDNEDYEDVPPELTLVRRTASLDFTACLCRLICRFRGLALALFFLYAG